MSIRARRRQLATVDGVEVWTRGTVDGLPLFGWGEAPAGLLTRGQLREIDLTPGRADPAAVLTFHTRRWGWTTADLYRIGDAVPRPGDRPGWAAGRVLAMTARRTCRTCTRVVDHCVRGPRRQCVDCYEPEEHAA